MVIHRKKNNTSGTKGTSLTKDIEPTVNNKGTEIVREYVMEVDKTKESVKKNLDIITEYKKIISFDDSKHNNKNPLYLNSTVFKKGLDLIKSNQDFVIKVSFNDENQYVLTVVSKSNNIEVPAVISRDIDADFVAYCRDELGMRLNSLSFNGKSNQSQTINNGKSSPQTIDNEKSSSQTDKISGPGNYTAVFNFSNPSSLHATRIANDGGPSFSPMLGHETILSPFIFTDGLVTLSFNLNLEGTPSLRADNTMYMYGHGQFILTVKGKNCYLRSVELDGDVGELDNMDSGTRKWVALYDDTQTEIGFMNGRFSAVVNKLVVNYTCVSEINPVVKKSGNDVVREYDVALDKTDGWEWRAINFMESYQKAVGFDSLKHSSKNPLYLEASAFRQGLNYIKDKRDFIIKVGINDKNEYVLTVESKYKSKIGDNEFSAIILGTANADFVAYCKNILGMDLNSMLGVTLPTQNNSVLGPGTAVFDFSNPDSLYASRKENDPYFAIPTVVGVSNSIDKYSFIEGPVSLLFKSAVVSYKNNYKGNPAYNFVIYRQGEMTVNISGKGCFLKSVEFDGSINLNNMSNNSKKWIANGETKTQVNFKNGLQETILDKIAVEYSCPKS